MSVLLLSSVISTKIIQTIPTHVLPSIFNHIKGASHKHHRFFSVYPQPSTATLGKITKISFSLILKVAYALTPF